MMSLKPFGARILKRRMSEASPLCVSVHARVAYVGSRVCVIFTHRSFELRYWIESGHADCQHGPFWHQEDEHTRPEPTDLSAE